MLIKEIEFEDYDGQRRKGKYYFNLSKAETIMWLTTTGEYTLDKVLLRLSEERNGKRIMEIMEDLIHRSYGRKSLDGIRFEKNDEIWLEFKESEAYSELFSELVTEADKAAEFVKGIIPASLAKGIEQTLIENKDGVPAEMRDYIPQIVGKSTT